MTKYENVEKKSYESPEFSFEELVLSEDIADKCWGFAYAWYDGNQDGDFDESYETINLKDIGLKENGCQGNTAVNGLRDYFKEHFPDVQIEDKDVKTNVGKDSIIIVPRS